MKLVVAIINHDDAHSVIQHLTKDGFQVTKLATTGGFLQVGNVTILIGVEDEKLPVVMKTIEKHSHSRNQAVPSVGEMAMFAAIPAEVTVGGATLFVLDVEQFKKF